MAVTSRLAALAAIGLACGPRYEPEGPTQDVGAPSQKALSVHKRKAAGAPPSRQILLGEMCPKAAANRPAVKPILVRQVSWEETADAVSRPVEANEARQFQVLGWDGRRVGLFTVAGAAQATGGQGIVATGSYVGSSPCQPPARSTAEVRFDDNCVKALGHCGLAISVLEPGAGIEARPIDEAPEPVQLETAGACTADSKLLVDVDGDGKQEAYRLADFVDPFRGPPDEVAAIDRGKSRCKTRFALRGAVPAGDPRDWRGLDVLGVVDLDADGRREIVLAYHYADRSTWAVYTAMATPARLDLAGEGVPF